MVEVDETCKMLGKIDLTASGLLVVVGIPAFNEERTIAKVVLGAQKHANIVVVCDDGSADSTPEIAERLGAIVIRHYKNLGYGAALQSLFKRARDLKADVLVTLDSDGQHDPSEIPRLVKPIEAGVAEVVLGSRFITKDGTAEMPAYRQLGVKVITKLSNGSGKNAVSDSQSGYRAYSRTAMETLGNISEKGMSASIELIRSIRKNGLNICEVPVTCKYGDNTSDTSTKHPLSHGIGLIMSLIKLIVEDRPLPFLGIPGILCLMAGTVFGVWMMQLYAIEGEIMTNIALASIGFILIGFFLISTAITLYSISRIANKIQSS
ncbi:MAG: glycosyltransferase family 2 protein [Candidatus Bathyarchaeota archaeon]|nr:glycosyltransferase family 2 protein [Candidatus Bathyarchaeota archaeon]